MAYSSGYCRGKMEQYRQVISQIGGLNGGIDACGVSISGSDGNVGVNFHVNKLIISGKTIDDGKLAAISSNVSNIQGMLSPVKAECEEKILYWNALYREALAREMEEAKKKKR